MVLLGLVGLGLGTLGSLWTVRNFWHCKLSGYFACPEIGPGEYVNWWLYETKLGEKQYFLPPGDMGLPFFGNNFHFLTAFKSGNPDSFINSFEFVSRFGEIGIYKACMFGFPSVICTVPETNKRVLTDDEAFKPGWPVATVELIGRRSFVGISYEDHRPASEKANCSSDQWS